MKGVEEFECTTVVVILKFILGTSSHVLWTITRVYHIERSVFELSRTTRDIFSIHSRGHSTKSNKQKIFELKKIKCSVWMFQEKPLGPGYNVLFSNEFDWVRSSNEVELFTEKHEWNKIVYLIKRWNSQGDLKFCFFPTVEPLYKGPVLSGQFSKSRFFAHTNVVFVTCIRRPPLLRGC